jgi:6,7-dimethyl-8-ribityllumazine synthase
MPAGPAAGSRALVVVSRFNEGVTRKLLQGARDALAGGGYPETALDVVWVPGAFELPLAVTRGLGTGRYALAVALGAVIRGETPHFDFVAGAATHALAEAAVRFGVPVGYGLLTCDTLEQALARAGGDAGNKGAEAAAAALETAAALAHLDGRAPS